MPVSGFCVLQSPQAPSLIETREAAKVFASSSSSSSLHHKLVGFVGFFFFFAAKLREVVGFSFSRFVGFYSAFVSSRERERERERGWRVEER